MNFIRSNKSLLIGLVVAIAVVYGICLYPNSGGSGGLLTTTPTSSATAVADLLVALANLQAVKLDSSVFSDPVFQSLSDFGVPIPSQPIGRPNPFLPLSGSGGSSSITLPSNITSGTATKK